MAAALRRRPTGCDLTGRTPTATATPTGRCLRRSGTRGGQPRPPPLPACPRALVVAGGPDWWAGDTADRGADSGRRPMNLTLEYHRSPARYLADGWRPAPGRGASPGRSPATSSPLRLVNRPTRARPARAGRGSAVAVRHLRLRPRAADRTRPRCTSSAARLDAVRPRPRGGRRARSTTCRACPGTPGRARPGAGLRRPRRGAVPRCAPGRPAAATTSPPGGWRPACRPASAPTPAAAGAGMLVAHAQPAAPGAGRAADEPAVLVEPLACAVHAVRRVGQCRTARGAGGRRRARWAC